MVFDGDAMVIRTCVAILGCVEARLYGSREEVLGILGWQGRLVGLAGMDEDRFMEVVRDVGKKERRQRMDGENSPTLAG